MKQKANEATKWLVDEIFNDSTQSKKLQTIYNEYSSNPIQWMKKENCKTTADVTIRLMEKAAEFSNQQSKM